MTTGKQWVEHNGGDGPASSRAPAEPDASGPGKGKRIVFVSGDEEYRSEEALPMLGKLMATHHGFDCTVLFAIDPETGTIDPMNQTNIPGLEALDDADMMVLGLRFRELPDDQMKHVIDYVNSGRPVMGLRTSTHAFRYTRNADGPYAKYGCRSKVFEGGFGRQVLGENWVSHHGRHGKESTRGVINEALKDHPVLRGVTDMWGPSDVYTVTTLTGDTQVLVDGQVLTGMKPGDEPKPDTPTMPLAWIRTYTGDEGKTSRVFCTTAGASVDLQSAGFRRLLVNGCYWCVGMEDRIDAGSCVDVVGEYEPTFFGVGTHRKGVRPSDHAL